MNDTEAAVLTVTVMRGFLPRKASAVCTMAESFAAELPGATPVYFALCLRTLARPHRAPRPQLRPARRSHACGRLSIGADRQTADEEDDRHLLYDGHCTDARMASGGVL